MNDQDAAGASLLIVEDDPGLCRQYRWAFPGRTVMLAGDRAGAVEIARREQPQVAIIDLGLPPDPDGITEGLAILDALVREVPGIKVIVATGNGKRENALLAIGRGAYDFFEKPVDIEILRIIVDRVFQLAALEQENRRLSAIGSPSPLPRVITGSESMLKICRTIEKLAPSTAPVLLLGESGTGKEILAQSLHELSPRAKAPFIAINCGAIPEPLLESELFGHEKGAFTGAIKQTPGRIELAKGGTLFLDEIGDLPLGLQVKLLRFLQESVIERVGGRKPIQVDARIVSATHQNLDQLVDTGRFRLDLLFRLNIVSVKIPPLRDRQADAILLGRYFLNRFAREQNRPGLTFAESALAALARHSWPGNVRELENRVRRAAIMADHTKIEARDLDLADAAPLPVHDLRTARREADRAAIQMALARVGGSITAAAKLLGVSRPTLYGLISGLGLSDAVKADRDDSLEEDVTDGDELDQA